jgi:hypothetical protein
MQPLAGLRATPSSSAPRRGEPAQIPPDYALNITHGELPSLLTYPASQRERIEAELGPLVGRLLPSSGLSTPGSGGA